MSENSSAERRVAYEAMMNNQPCAGCLTEANPHWPVTDDLVACERCDWRGSGSYLHSCLTGWREKVCRACNEAARESRKPPHPGKGMRR
jgi:hypothetical protein